MSKVEAFLRQSPDWVTTLRRIELLQNEIKKLQSAMDPDKHVNLEVRVGSWQCSRTLQVCRKWMMLRLTAHNDNCDTCKKRVREVYGTYNSKFGRIYRAQAGEASYGHTFLEVELAEDSEPLTLLKKALGMEVLLTK